MSDLNWTLLGSVDALIVELQNSNNLLSLELEGRKILLSYHNSEFGAISSRCNHMGAPPRARSY